MSDNRDRLVTRGVEPGVLEEGWMTSSLCGSCDKPIEWGGSIVDPIVGEWTHYDPRADHAPVLVPVCP